MNREKITVRLDAVRKYRNKSEYRTVQRARCNDIEVIGDGPVIRRVLHQVHEAGVPIDAVVEVYRGETLCFRRMTLETWTVPGKNPIQRRVHEGG